MICRGLCPRKSLFSSEFRVPRSELLGGTPAPDYIIGDRMRVVPSTAHGDVPLQAPFFLELRSEVRPHGERIDAPSLLHLRQAKVNASASPSVLTPRQITI